MRWQQPRDRVATVARGRSAETNARQGLCQQTRTTEVHLYLKDKQPK